MGSSSVPQFYVYHDDSLEPILVGRCHRFEDAETAMMSLASHLPGRHLVFSLVEDDIVAEMADSPDKE